MAFSTNHNKPATTRVGTGKPGIMPKGPGQGGKCAPPVKGTK